MASATHTCFNAGDRSYSSIIKRDIHKIASEANFTKTKVNAVDIIISEITSNLVKHTQGGEILAGIVEVNGETALEIIAIDHGPGIRDIKKVQVDGISTTNTLGQGLGSIKRLSDTLEIYSQVGWGTILLCRVFKNKVTDNVKPKPAVLQTKAIIVPKNGETFCGDGWYQKTTKEHVKIFLGDGLGHGPQANFAVSEAVNAFKLCAEDSPVEILRYMHQSIRKTRGVVALVMVYTRKTKQWKICGIGNIAVRLTGIANSKRHISYNGIVGHNIPNSMNDQVIAEDMFRQFTLCSDGITSRWDQAKFPMIQQYDLAIQAAALYKDFGRKTDDMSVILGKLK